MRTTAGFSNRFIRGLRILLAGVLGWMHLQAICARSEDLEETFRSPPAAARPWVYWFWVDGNITREGITADLEAMERVGLGGVLLMDVAQEIPTGDVGFGSPEWRALLKHSVLEATRLGLEVTLHNSAGWTGSGGPWITPEQGMQRLVFTRTNVNGPGRFSAKLPGLARSAPEPPTFAVVAFASLPGEGAPLRGFAPRITASAQGSFHAAHLLDPDPATEVGIRPPGFFRGSYIQLEFAKPYAASRLVLQGKETGQEFEGVLEISDNGRTFKRVREFRSRDGGLSLNFGMTSARFYRLRFTSVAPNVPELRFNWLELAPIWRIENYPTKAGMGRLPFPDPKIQSTRTGPQPPEFATVPPRAVIDLTAHLSADGHLEWNVPEGSWTVLRAGYMPVLTLNHPARPGGLGLECDKLGKGGIETHFKSFLEPIIDEIQSAGGTALTGGHIDSWEVGFQNWTASFVEEFRKRRGYDPIPYLPACTGVVVGSLEISDRFLWDMRRTIADLVADNYAGHLAELLRGKGLTLSMESYGNAPFDDLLCAARVDIPMTEFWSGHPVPENKAMASAAHTYGKTIVAAEAFTATAGNGKWMNHPASMKPLADAVFCEGVNRFVFHRFAHQPWTNRAPGMTMGPWGAHYERTVTWWEQSKGWHQYLARCQALLQSGRFVADVCYLTDEGAYNQPPGRSQLQPPLPDGFDYDLATPEIILRATTGPDGVLRLPGGMEYKVLVLPPTRTITPVLLGKVAELVRQGATAIGQRRTRSPSLAGFPGCDTEVERIARDLWGDLPESGPAERKVGSGKIVQNKPLQEVLAGLGAGPDFRQGDAEASLRWIHRRTDSADFYFVANTGTNFTRTDCEFRVTGSIPEFWHPDSGNKGAPPSWRALKDRTGVRIELEPGGSVFVVFKRGTGTRTTAPERITELSQPIRITGAWELAFSPGLGAPAQDEIPTLQSWTEANYPGIKYFSGTATYTKQIDIPADWLSGETRIMLDLGTVHVIAEVEVNGKPLGVLWKPPFRIDIRSAVRAGTNELAIKVTNLWPNRLIGDEHMGEDDRWRRSHFGEGQVLARWPDWLLQGERSPSGRIAFTTWKHYTKDSPLLPSGLLGPVTLQCLGVEEPG